MGVAEGMYQLRPILNANISAFRSDCNPFPGILNVSDAGHLAAEQVEVGVRPTRVIFKGGDSVVWNEKSFQYLPLAKYLGSGDSATLSFGQSVRAFEGKDRWVVDIGDMTSSRNNYYFMHEGPKDPAIPFSVRSGSAVDAVKGTTEQAVQFVDIKVRVRYRVWILPITMIRDFRFYAACEKGSCSWLPTNPYDPMSVNRPYGFGLEISDESFGNKPLAW
jgi:hypothetical protein